MRYAPGKKTGKQNNLNPWQQYKPRDLKENCQNMLWFHMSTGK
jgi:hypothetical protein